MRLSVVLWLAFGLLYVNHGQDETTRKEAASAETGLQVGEQAPAFTFRDQFGQTGSSTTLRGPNGTVLLFFRSADW
jgi:cytochrome oxidase Cu insertion factor (SCO1/SenC/PrrC family)